MNNLVAGPLREPGSGGLHDNESFTISENHPEGVYKVKTEERTYEAHITWYPDDPPSQEELIEILRGRLQDQRPSKSQRYRLPFSLGDVIVHKVADDTVEDFTVYLGRLAIMIPTTGVLRDRVRNIDIYVEDKDALMYSRPHHMIAGFGAKKFRFLSYTPKNRE